MSKLQKNDFHAAKRWLRSKYGAKVVDFTLKDSASVLVEKIINYAIEERVEQYILIKNDNPESKKGTLQEIIENEIQERVEQKLLTRNDGKGIIQKIFDFFTCPKKVRKTFIQAYHQLTSFEQNTEEEDIKAVTRDVAEDSAQYAIENNRDVDSYNLVPYEVAPQDGATSEAENITRNGDTAEQEENGIGGAEGAERPAEDAFENNKEVESNVRVQDTIAAQDDVRFEEDQRLKEDKPSDSPSSVEAVNTTQDQTFPKTMTSPQDIKMEDDDGVSKCQTTATENKVPPVKIVQKYRPKKKQASCCPQLPWKIRPRRTPEARLGTSSRPIARPSSPPRKALNRPWKIKPKKPCPYLDEKGRCKHGKHCWFEHNF